MFISAFVIPRSQAEKAMLKIIDGDDSLFISKAIIDETLSVLASKFKRDREAISHLAVYLADIAALVKPTKTIQILKDEPDNRILECAHCGSADIIVTGDKEMLRQKEYKGIKIISLKDYLQGI